MYYDNYVQPLGIRGYFQNVLLAAHLLNVGDEITPIGGDKCTTVTTFLEHLFKILRKLVFKKNLKLCKANNPTEFYLKVTDSAIYISEEHMDH